MRAHEPLAGLDGFPLERVIEIHVAGGTPREVNGFAFVEDTHTANVLDDTWVILDHVMPRCPNLKAVVFECERNSQEHCLAGFDRIHGLLAGTALA